MKNLYKTHNSFKLMLLIVTILFSATQLSAQETKPTSSGYVPVNGIKMYYEEYTPAAQASGEPVVLLHGAFLTINLNWSELIPELSKTRKVIAIEFQGHGHSPFSERQLSFPSLASDVKGVMDYLKIDSADVVGYSMGGTVAYEFAIQNPGRLKKLVIISSTYKSSGWLPAVNNNFKNFKPELFNNTPLQTAYNAAAPDTSKWTKFIEHMIAFAGKPFGFGDSNIAKITAPVLIISGDNDGLDKVELMKTYQLLGGGIAADMQPMPKSQLAIIPSQTHVSLMMTQATTILKYINDFLK